MEDILIGIPTNVENLLLPDAELLTYYKNLENREIWLDEDVSCNTLEIGKQILLWNKQDDILNIKPEDRKAIKLFIFSYGGDLEVCYSLLDIIALSKTPIITINTGVAMSAGLMILLSGHKRYCTKMSQVLIHQGSGDVSGTYETARSHMEAYDKLVEMMGNYIVDRTNIDLKTYKRKKSKEWFAFSEEQVSLGIVDKVLTSLDDIK